jgi:hypothetical protein
MKIAKQLRLLILCMAIAFTLVGCKSGSDSSSTDSNYYRSDSSNNTKPDEPIEPLLIGKIVKINGEEIPVFYSNQIVLKDLSGQKSFFIANNGSDKIMVKDITFANNKDTTDDGKLTIIKNNGLVGMVLDGNGIAYEYKFYVMSKEAKITLPANVEVVIHYQISGSLENKTKFIKFSLIEKLDNLLATQYIVTEIVDNEDKFQHSKLMSDKIFAAYQAMNNLKIYGLYSDEFDCECKDIKKISRFLDLLLHPDKNPTESKGAATKSFIRKRIADNFFKDICSSS